MAPYFVGGFLHSVDDCWNWRLNAIVRLLQLLNANSNNDDYNVYYDQHDNTTKAITSALKAVDRNCKIYTQQWLL